MDKLETEATSPVDSTTTRTTRWHLISLERRVMSHDIPFRSEDMTCTMGDMTVVRQETTRWSRIDRRGFEKRIWKDIEKDYRKNQRREEQKRGGKVVALTRRQEKNKLAKKRYENGMKSNRKIDASQSD